MAFIDDFDLSAWGAVGVSPAEQFSLLFSNGENPTTLYSPMVNANIAAYDVDSTQYVFPITQHDQNTPITTYYGLDTNGNQRLWNGVPIAPASDYSFGNQLDLNDPFIIPTIGSVNVGLYPGADTNKLGVTIGAFHPGDITASGNVSINDFYGLMTVNSLEALRGQPIMPFQPDGAMISLDPSISGVAQLDKNLNYGYDPVIGNGWFPLLNIPDSNGDYRLFTQNNMTNLVGNPVTNIVTADNTGVMPSGAYGFLTDEDATWHGITATLELDGHIAMDVSVRNLPAGGLDINLANWGASPVSPALDTNAGTVPVIGGGSQLAPFVISYMNVLDGGNNAIPVGGTAVTLGGDAIWTDMRAWGGTPNIYPAFDLNSATPLTSGDVSTPLVSGVILGRDATYGQFFAIGSTLDLGTFNSTLWTEVHINGSSISDVNPVPIKNAVNDQRQRYTATDTTVYNYSFNTKNLEAYLTTDATTGLTFNADLLWSGDGGTTFYVIKNFTEADVNSWAGRYVLVNATLNFYAIRMNSINFGGDGTFVDFSTFAMAI